MAGVWVLVATTLLTLHQATAAPIVNAPWGRIQGRDSVSVSGLNYSSYLAIPYARPPVGGLRFAKPVVHPGYRDGLVFNATTQGDQCVQTLMGPPRAGAVGMSEDCLTLNVHVPMSVSGGPKTVMVWIHGGGFFIGSASSQTPSELVTENDVIVVVIQYRLDALGFLSSGDDTVPGNFGLWDQNLALRWVKTNIGAFGGDPESMTVFGGSAGSFSLGFHIISPASREMRFRAIMQSGAPLSIGCLNKNPGQAFLALANRTGCLHSNWTRGNISSDLTFEVKKRMESKRILACLRTKDARDLLQVEGMGFGSWSPMKPVVDGDFVPRDPALLTSDVAYLDYVRATRRDVMLGVNNDEGGFAVSRADLYNGDDEIEGFYQKGIELEKSLLRNQLLFRYGEDIQTSGRLDTLVDVLQFFYTQGANGGARLVTKQNLADTFSDIEFVLSAVQFSRDLAKAKAQTASFRRSLGRHYLYLFNHFPSSRAALTELRGTYHGEDADYEFDPMAMGGGRSWFGSDEYTIASAFRTMVTSFAKTGQPQVPLLGNQTSGISVFPEFILNEEKYLSLDTVPRVESRLFGSRMALWTDLVPSLYNFTQAPESTRYWTWQKDHKDHRSLFKL